MKDAEHARGDGISIALFEDWMAPQIIELIAGNYGREIKPLERFFQRFYEHPFQRPRGIRLVALDGERVCGFQSYFYWPYMQDGQPVRSYQSGQSLVAEDYRGRRIFSRLLNYLADTEASASIDFLVGFPVPMSFGSFIRNGWEHPADVVWYVRPIRPLSVVRGMRPHDRDFRFDRSPERVNPAYPTTGFALSKESDFLEWRRSYESIEDPHLYYHYSEGAWTLRFELKANRRGRANELIIGDIVTDSNDRRFVRAAFRDLISFARTHRFLSFLSIALNPDAERPLALEPARRTGFVRIRGKRIPLIVKPMAADVDLLDASRWHILRSDMDTW